MPLETVRQIRTHLELRPSVWTLQIQITESSLRNTKEPSPLPVRQIRTHTRLHVINTPPTPRLHVRVAAEGSRWSPPLSLAETTSCHFFACTEGAPAPATATAASAGGGGEGALPHTAHSSLCRTQPRRHPLVRTPTAPPPAVHAHSSH